MRSRHAPVLSLERQRQAQVVLIKLSLRTVLIPSPSKVKNLETKERKQIEALAATARMIRANPTITHLELELPEDLYWKIRGFGVAR